MLKYLLFGLFLAWSQSLVGQDFRIEKVDDKEISAFAKRISFFKYLDLGQEPSITVLFLENKPGSAKRDAGWITHDIALVVSEWGDFPNYKMFVLKDIYRPKLLPSNPEQSKNSIIGFSYVDNHEFKKEMYVKVTLNEITFLK
jgi:hypothetical protein